MKLYATVGGTVAQCKAGRVTIHLNNGATVTGMSNHLEMGDKVLVGLNRRTGKFGTVWVKGTFTHDPEEQPLPEDEIFEED